MAADFWPGVFVRPIPIMGIWRLAMLVPLALSISIVYKAIRCESLRSVPGASLKLCTMIVTGMMMIGVVLLVVFRLLA